MLLRCIAFLATAVTLAACQLRGAASHDDTAARRILGNGVALYAAGDIADCKNISPGNSAAARTARLIEQQLSEDKDAIVLTLGDHTYPLGRAEEFLRCYDPTWGKFKQRTYPTPGNHDYYTPQAAGYYGYFGDAAGPNRRGYYSFNIGTWHVVALNSDLKPEQLHAQLDWLKRDLERHNSLCTLAFWHHPMFSSGGHGGSARMAEAWKLLQLAGAELVLSGHDHDYERFAPQDKEGHESVTGIRQFVVGTGGATLTPFGFRKWNSERGDNTSHGVLKIVLKQAGYEWEFMPVEKDGFRDRGWTRCH